MKRKVMNQLMLVVVFMISISANASGILSVKIENSSVTDFEVKVTPVIKTHYGVNLINKSEVTIFKPKVHVNNGIVKVMLTRTANTPLTVSIYDVNGVLLIDENATQEDGVIFERNYNFSQIASGTYFINFDLGDRKFSKEITM